MRKAVGGGVPLEVGGLGANKCTANRILVAASVWALGTSFADRVYSVGQPGAKQCRHGTKAGDPSIELCVLCKAVVWRACKCGICVRVRVRGPRLVHRSTWVKNTHGGEVSWATPRRWACCSWLRREYTRYSVTLCHVTRAATCNLADAYAWSYKGGRRVDTSTRWPAAASMQNE